MQQAASRCRCERGEGDTRSLGSPAGVHPPPKGPQDWGWGVPRGVWPHPLAGSCVDQPFPRAQGGCSHTRPSLPASPPPLHARGRAHRPLSRAASPAAWSILVIFSTVVAARSWGWLFLAIAAAAAAGKGLRGVVLHCRRWVLGLVGAMSWHMRPPQGAAHALGGLFLLLW